MDAVVLFFRALLLLVFFKATGLLRVVYEALSAWALAFRFWMYCGVMRRVVRDGRLTLVRHVHADQLCMHDCLVDGRVMKTVARGGDPDTRAHVARRAVLRASVMAVIVHPAPGVDVPAKDLGAVAAFVQERACGFEEAKATVVEVLRLAEAACGLKQRSVGDTISFVTADFAHADFSCGDVIDL